MNWMRLNRNGAMRLAAFAFLFALLTRALVPAGWMPGEHALVFCTSAGQVEISVDADGKPVTPQDHHRTADFCPFAAAPHLAQGAAEPPSLGGPVLLSSIVADAPYTERIALPLRRLREQAPRAPPIPV